MKAHGDVLGSVDFTTVEAWTKAGLTTFYLLFVLELKTRRVHIAGYTTNSTPAWMQQTARESRSPNPNAQVEQFFGSLTSECLDRLIHFGQQSLRNAVREYRVHYHTERDHQGIANRLIIPFERPPNTDAPVETTERRGDAPIVPLSIDGGRNHGWGSATVVRWTLTETH